MLGEGLDRFKVLELVDSVILTPSIATLLNPVDYPRLKNVSNNMAKTVSTEEYLNSSTDQCCIGLFGWRGSISELE